MHCERFREPWVELGAWRKYAEGFMMKTIMKVFFTMLLSTAAALAGDFKVGVVDTERVLRESVPAVKAEKRIEKEFSGRDEDIKKLIKQTKEAQAQLEQDDKSFPDLERRNKERELSSMNVTLQRMQREFREDLNLRKNEELALVLELANKAIQAIANAEHYDLILQEAVYRNPKIDITDKVIKYLGGTTDSVSDTNPEEMSESKPENSVEVQSGQ